MVCSSAAPARRWPRYQNVPRYGAHTPLAVSRYGGCEPAMRSASVGGGAKNKIGRLLIGALQGNSLQGKSRQVKFL